jgi:hypothetical protein
MTYFDPILVEIENQLHDYILKYTISNDFTRLENLYDIRAVLVYNITWYLAENGLCNFPLLNCKYIYSCVN